MLSETARRLKLSDISRSAALECVPPRFLKDRTPARAFAELFFCSVMIEQIRRGELMKFPKSEDGDRDPPLRVKSAGIHNEDSRGDHVGIATHALRVRAAYGFGTVKIE